MVTEEQLDEVYDTIDDLIMNTEYEQVDEILKNVNIKETNPEIIVAYLVLTYHAQRYLKERSPFLERVVNEINFNKYKDLPWMER